LLFVDDDDDDDDDDERLFSYGKRKSGREERGWGKFGG
jgi:hypothetical protein